MARRGGPARAGWPRGQALQVEHHRVRHLGHALHHEAALGVCARARGRGARHAHAVCVM